MIDIRTRASNAILDGPAGSFAEHNLDVPICTLGPTITYYSLEMPESADFQAARARFARVWLELLPILLGIFRRQGLGDQAQDLAQQVALRLFMRSDRISSDEQMKAYALTAARWIMADYWRAFSPVEDLGGSAMLDLPAAAPTPSEALEARQTALGAIARLTPREGEIVMRVMRGETTAEIARGMGVSPATVRSLLRYARHRILTALTDYEEPGEVSE